MKIAITAALAFALAACGSRDATENSNGNAASAAGNLTSPADGEDIATETEVTVDGVVSNNPTTAAEFANMAASSDQFEIRSSQMAATQASSAGVKAFAAMLVREHAASTADLKAAAAQGSPAVVPASAMTSEQTANLDALGRARGASFDTLYAQVQVPAHENALALLRGYAARGDQPALKAFAAKTAPIVEKHLEQARALAK